MVTTHQDEKRTASETPTEQALRASELSYRRLFEAAQDGILILDVATGRINDVNPFLVSLLGFTREEMVGKTVGELSPFKDIECNQAMLKRLQQHGYVRYEDLPLKTRDGRPIAVEFVSNVYQVGDIRVIQCNVRDITARKKSEERLALLSTCVANLNDIILITEAEPIDEPGPRIVFVNEAFEKITGYTSAEAIGRSPRFLQGEKTDRRVTAEIRQALAEKKPIRRQVVNYKKDGGEYWMDIDVVPVLNSSGRCTNFVAIERDITESKKLKESLKLFRTLMERSPDAIEVVDPETGHFLDVNETACRRLGYSREEMLSLGITDVVEAGDTRFSLQSSMDELRTIGSKTIETRHRRKDGSTYPVEINTQYIELDRGYVLAVVRDISDRRALEQTLRESEAKFRTLFEVAKDANFILHEGLFVDCNAKALELFGATREQLMGKCPSIFSPAVQPAGDDSPTKATEYIQKALAGHPQFFEWVHQRLDGTAVDTDISLSRFKLSGKIYVQVIIRDITDRKKVEKQLLWKTSFFEAQVHSALDGILIVDGDGKGILQNQRFIDLWNIPKEFANDADDSRQREWAASQTKNPRQFMERVLFLYAHPDEVSRDEIDLVDGRCFDRYSASVRGRDGTCYGRIWSFRDITERKVAELALHESESRYRSLFENMLEGYAYCQLLYEQDRAIDFVYLEVNLAFGTLLGLHNVIGKKVSELVPGLLEANPEVIELYARVALTGKAESREVHLKSMGLWLSLSAYSDRRGHFSVFFQNITERKQNESRFHRLVDSNAQGVIFWNKKGEVTAANEAYLRLVGYTREDLEAGRINWMTMTPPEFAELDRRAMEQITAKGVSEPYEKEYLRKDGSRVPVLLGAAAFEDNPEEGVCFFIDLTERKKLEHQFLRAQRMESIGTLAGGIAHDLNNILAPIMMSIDILKLTTTDPQAGIILETIGTSAKRGADIVRQVLSFARGLEGERVEVQIRHLLNEVESIVKDTFPKDIRLQFSIPHDIWTIQGDPTQVHQILLNLCVNARDAMPGGGTLAINVSNAVLDDHYIAMHPQAKAGRYVEINVIDSGTGMPQRIIDKIFEPFFTTKDVNKGTGLGLSTVMAIVKSHNGIINVYSEQGRGTTFKVYLPAMELSAETRRVQLEQAGLPRGNGETILLVDDEASIVTVTAKTLQTFGYKVLAATDGADAVGVYAQQRGEISLVLTDMAMPIMDGAATIRALLRLNPSVKIIAASGLNTNTDISSASASGIKHFLTKPYTASTLLKTIRTILDEA